MATVDLTKMEIWPSGFLLPSVDAECLQYLACVRICAAPIKPIVFSTAPWTTPSGTYPMFKVGNKVTCSNIGQFIKYLRTEISPNIPLDEHLTEAEKAEITAYESMLKLKLHPAYLHSLWMDVPNYNTFTTRWYGQQLPIGYGLYYAAKMRRSAVDYLRTVYPGKLTGEENIEFAVTKQALLCINLLSAKLDDKKYFYGDKPSSLDALVFGYLAPLLKLPLPNDRIQTHIRACPNLVRLIDSLISIYMPLTDEEITTQRIQLKEWEKRKDRAQVEMQRLRRRQKEENEPGSGEDEFPMRYKIMFAASALVLSLLIAVHTGLIQVEVREVNRENVEDTD